jgi:hypothetical protein
LPVALEATLLALMKRLWAGWKAFAHGLVAAQSWLLMAFAYVIAVAPVALAFKLFRPDPLDRGPADPTAKTYGRPPRFSREDIRRAQRPF